MKNLSVYDNKFLNTNSRGVRGTKECLYEKDEDITRILILGDSYTFGAEVGDTETFSFYLQETLPQTEVINFGVHGYGHDQMLIYYRKEGVKYNPDIVILGFIFDDMVRNILKFKDYSKPMFISKNGELKLQNVPVPPPEKTLKKERFRLKLVDLLYILYHKISWKNGKNTKKMYQKSTFILKELIDEIEDSGATPVFIYLPSYYQLDLFPKETIPPYANTEDYKKEKSTGEE